MVSYIIDKWQTNELQNKISNKINDHATHDVGLKHSYEKSNNKIEKSNLLNSEIIFTYFANCVNPIQQPLDIRFRDM